MKYKLFVMKLLLPSLLMGFMFQLNFLYLDFKVLKFPELFHQNWPRLVIGSVTVLAIVLLLYFAVRHFLVAYRGLQKLQASEQILTFTSFFWLYVMFPFFQMSQHSIFIISAFVPVLFVFNKPLKSLYGLIVGSVHWKIFFTGFAVLGFYNVSPQLVLLFYGIDVGFVHIVETLFAALFLLIPLLYFPNIYKIYLSCLVPFFYAPAIISILHSVTYGNEMPSSSYHALWETNSAEAAEYIGMYLDFKCIVIAILLLAVPLLFVLVPTFRKRTLSSSYTALLVFSVVLMFLAGYNSNYKQNALSVYVYNYFDFKDELNKLNASYMHRKLRHDPAPVCTAPAEDEETYVVVLGESLSRHHMGLYGYTRNTNPLLGKMKDSLYVFNNVISPHSHTNPVVEKLLTFANNDDKSPVTQKRSIIEYMRDAGFKTFWLSNQQFVNRFASFCTLLGTQSDWYYFINNAADDPVEAWDEKLMTPLNLVLNDSHKRKFIVLHLFGDHGEYSKRYPPAYNVYKDSSNLAPRGFGFSGWKLNQINTYDNSVLYNDAVVYAIIHRIMKLNHNAFVLYLSDHGEEVYDYRPEFTGHSEANASLYMFDIPFVLWVSDKYKVHNQLRMSHMASYTGRRYQTDVFIHSVIDLTNLTSQEFNPQWSIFNNSYVPRKRTIVNQDYDELIKTKKSVTD